MNHLTQEQLILLYYGESENPASTEAHIAGCAACRSEYQNLQLVLNTVDGAPGPDRPANYGAQVWERVAPVISARRGWVAGLSNLFQPRWWVLVPTAAVLLVTAFIAGRLSHRVSETTSASAGQIRERILLVAVGDHLDRSQMVLAELSNAPDGRSKIDISEEREQAQELLEDNRLYRQTARTTGDNGVATVLDDLERVLLEVAHSPSTVSTQQLEQLQQEIRDRGLLFKVRVMGSQARQRESTPVRSDENSQGSKL
ncbi:MAG: hypothetical protein M3Z32_07070 [Acidobacteriota bacterium]|nr:hypothetical protein [Acidobacteriota bacterium]